MPHITLENSVRFYIIRSTEQGTGIQSGMWTSFTKTYSEWNIRNIKLIRGIFFFIYLFIFCTVYSNIHANNVPQLAKTLTLLGSKTTPYMSTMVSGSLYDLYWMYEINTWTLISFLPDSYGILRGSKLWTFNYSYYTAYIH